LKEAKRMRCLRNAGTSIYNNWSVGARKNCAGDFQKHCNNKTFEGKFIPSFDTLNYHFLARNLNI